MGNNMGVCARIGTYTGVQMYVVRQALVQCFVSRYDLLVSTIRSAGTVYVPWSVVGSAQRLLPPSICRLEAAAYVHLELV